MTFCSDLDNTLIYSYRRNIPQPKIPAEYLDGKTISYMTEQTFQFLSTQKSIPLIPVTTRTEAQYKRIFLFQKHILCRYALVCNGAILLKDGVVQNDWLTESLRLGEAGFREIRRLQMLMAHSKYCEHMHYAEPGILYFVPEETVSVETFLLQCADTENVLICVNGRKVYCIPKNLTKGIALQRLRRYLHLETLFAAGDSSMDIPMLNEADIAFCTEEIAEHVHAPKTIAFGNVMSDWICEYLKNHFM